MLQQELDALHTTAAGKERIRKNCCLSAEIDPLQWCREQIAKPESKTVFRGKNSYITTDCAEITINRSSLTVITAHLIRKNREKKQNSSLKTEEGNGFVYCSQSGRLSCG